MLDLFLPLYNFNLAYTHKLVDDIPDERLCEQPVPGVSMNHAAFLIGHLAWSKDRLAEMLGGGPSQFPDAWKPLFAMGSKPLPDRAAYPSKAELLAAFDAAHARLPEAVNNASPELLASPAPERMRSRFPTMQNVVVGMMVGHFAMHLGQLSAWRRALGFPSAT
jgi:hypothetical protein